MSTARPVVSIVTAAYNEAENLPSLYERLVKALDGTENSWEWLVVDDHSRDRTFDVVRRIAASDGRVRGIRLARNSGSHLAMKCGLDAAHGQCAVILAGDLQDPPEAVISLLEKWRSGCQVVWAIREKRENESASTLLFARFYYWMMRSFVGLQEMPSQGADFFLMDRRVLEAFREFRESNLSIIALVSWMGFRQDRIIYQKNTRLHGTTSWNLSRKLKLVVDSVTSFTYLPIRIMSFAGFAVALAGFLYAGVVIVNYFSGVPTTGWSSLMVVMLIIGGFQMLLMGVLGEYLWRTLDETRRRPRFLIEDTAPASSVGSPEPLVDESSGLGTP